MFIKITPKKDEFDAKSQKFQNVAEKISYNLLKMLKFWFEAVRMNVDLLALEKGEKNDILDAKIGVDTTENEPIILMTYAMGISISYLQVDFIVFFIFFNQSRKLVQTVLRIPADPFSVVAQ